MKTSKNVQRTLTNHVPYLSNNFLHKDAYQSNVGACAAAERRSHQLSLIFADKIQIAASELLTPSRPRAITATHVSHALSRYLLSLIFWTPTTIFCSATPPRVDQQLMPYHTKPKRVLFLSAERLPILIKNFFPWLCGAACIKRAFFCVYIYIYIRTWTFLGRRASSSFNSFPILKELIRIFTGVKTFYFSSLPFYLLNALLLHHSALHFLATRVLFRHAAARTRLIKTRRKRMCIKGCCWFGLLKTAPFSLNKHSSTRPPCARQQQLFQPFSPLKKSFQWHQGPDFSTPLAL